MNTIEKKLADGLKEAGKKNLALSSVVPKISDDVQRDMSMENVAKPIAEAIFDGEARVFRVSVNDVNSMQDVCADVLYILDDSGIIGGNPPLSVNAGDVVVFNGLSWQKIGGGAGPAIDAYTKSETDNRISEGILAHNALSDSHADIRHSITAEATARAAADTSLGGRIDDAEEAIGNEADERAESDRDLQSQIDAITSKSDVVDVVASYVELVAYDTSSLGDNDVVKVLEDEMHDNAESYYRWDITTETWGYIGSQGPFVTPAEMQTALGGKADKVSNATSGHLAGLDGNGNLTDSGIGASDIANKVFIAIEYTTPFNDILAAYNAGKVILLASQDGSRYYYLMNYRDNHAGARPRFTFYYKDLDFESNSLRDTYTYVESNNEWRNISVLSAERTHASASTAYGVGSENAYGHVQLTGNITNNSSKAVKSGAVYDALQDIIECMASKQDVLASNSLAFIYKPTNGDATKFLNEQGDFVTVDGKPIQKIVVGQTLRRRHDCLYSYGSNNVLYVMTGWVERRQSGAPYEMILRTVNTDSIAYMKVLITEQFVVYTVSGMNGFLYNIWNLEDSINTDVVLVTYKQGVVNPSFDALLNAVHNRRDVLLVAYTADGEEQEYYHLQWWKFYSSDGVYDFHFALYDESAHRLKSYRFSYNTGGSLINAVGEVFSPISSVGTNNINDGAVTNEKLADFTIGGGKIAGGAISPMHLSTSINLKYFITSATEGSYVEDDEYFAATASTIGLKYTAKNARAYMNARAYARLTFTAKRSYQTTSSGRVFNGVDHVESFSISSATNGYIHGLFGHHANLVILDLRKSGTWTDTLDLYFNIDQISSGVPYTLMVYNRTGNAVQITFRVNASTALTNSYVNGTTGTGNRNYTIDAGSLENILIERDGNDLYLNAIWHGF